MTENKFMRVLAIVALLIIGSVWYVNSQEKEKVEPMGIWEKLITNRVDEYGRAGKTILDEQWQFKHCTSTSTNNCGRLN